MRSANSRRMSAPATPKAPLAPAKPVQPAAKPKLQQVSAPAKVKPVTTAVSDKKKAAQPTVKAVVKQVAKPAPLPIVKLSPVTIKPVVPAKPEEQREYNVAFGNIKPKPSQAIRQFRDFLKKYPRSPLAANAQYWLGEVMYSSKNYRGAIDEFVVVLEQYGDSSKAPDAAIKLGYSFYEMKNWVYARRTLQDIIRNFPKTQAAGLAEARLSKMKQANLY